MAKQKVEARVAVQKLEDGDGLLNLASLQWLVELEATLNAELTEDHRYSLQRYTEAYPHSGLPSKIREAKQSGKIFKPAR